MDENLEPSSEANADPGPAIDVERGGTDAGTESAPAVDGQDGGGRAALDDGNPAPGSGSAGDSAGDASQADPAPADLSPAETSPADALPADVVRGEAAEAGPGSAPADVTTSEATQPLTSTPDMLQSAAEMIDAGGPVVIILLVMSIGALAIILAKIWQFAGAGLGDRRPVEHVLA